MSNYLARSKPSYLEYNKRRRRDATGPTVRQKRKQKGISQRLDPALHGDVHVTSFVKGGQFAAPRIATRWLGQDFIVTVPWFIQPWYEWPQNGASKHRFKAAMRQGAWALSTRALLLAGPSIDYGYHAGSVPWLPKLKQHLESVAVVRLVPSEGGWTFFEEDGLIHWFHHMRDGVYDVWAGYSFDSSGRLVANGQYEDDNNKPGFVPIQYNQIYADGHGVAFVFRFRSEFVETKLLTG